MLARLATLVIVVFSFSYSQSQINGTVILGMLEDHPGHYAGEPNFRVMRALFQKRGDHWQAFPSNCRDRECLEMISSKYPHEMTWTITFDGKEVGEVEARTQAKFRYHSEIGLQDIATETKVPTIGTQSVEFSGFLSRPVFRPLVANSQPYFKDPDTWKPTHISTEIIPLLVQQFRKQFPKLCRETKPESGQLKTYSYRDDEVAIVKAYSSRTGWTVAKLHLEAIDCDDLEAGFDIDDPWFVVSPRHTVAYLDSGMWLVDAGDYDNDGKSEIIFAIDRYNRGGYELFYDDFREHVTFEFGYH